MNISHIMSTTVLVLAIQIFGCADPHDVDGDRYAEKDCAPDDGHRYPGAPETPYDGVDQDCDGLDLIDVDGDGVPGPLAGGTDCDDDDPTISPLASEVPYDGIDQDCRGGDLRDRDGDSFAAVAMGGTDCDDDDPTIHPGAVELADGRDQNCNGFADETTAAFDDDGDGYSEANGDCNDMRADIHPGAQEIPGNMLDEDCNNGDLTDGDGDGFAGELYGGPDCDDANPTIYPGATEVPDQADNNCNSVVDEHTAIFDDDNDGYSEAGGDCNDYNNAIHPGADEVINGLDDDCDVNVDELTLELSPAAMDSLTPTTQSGPLSSTPGDAVYKPAGFIAMYVRYIVRSSTNAVTDVVEVLARPPLPARYGFPSAPAHAYTLSNGSVRWIVAGAPVPPGAVDVGEVQVVPRVPFSAPLQAGDHVERWYVGVDAVGNRSMLAGATLNVTAAPLPMIEESGTLVTLQGISNTVHDLPTFAQGDLLLLTNQEQAVTVDDDWAWDCVPAALGSGGIRLNCRTEFDNDNGKAMLARVWRVRAPAKVRCITESGSATSCAIPPTIVVANDKRWTAFIECPIGYNCLTVITPFGEWTGVDDDFGWLIDKTSIDPLRDLGIGGISELSSMSSGALPTGYIANLRGDIVELGVHGGNPDTYARFSIAQVMIPVSMPIATSDKQFRSLERFGLTASPALCIPTAGPAIIAPVLSTYDPHYEPGPSLLSRIGGVLKSTASLASSGFELATDFGPGSVIGAIKSVIGFITSLFNLGAPQSDRASVVGIDVDPTPSDPTCVDLTTNIQFTDNSEPLLEHAITLYSLYEVP